MRTVRLPPFFLLAFILAGASAHAEEDFTRLPIGTLQMTGRGAAQPPIPGPRALTDSARRDARTTQTHISIGTLQMTGRAEASRP